MAARKKKDVIGLSGSLILRQSNKISRAPTVPGLRQGKVYRYLLMRARPFMKDKEAHQVYLDDIRAFLGSHDLNNFEEDIENLMSIFIKWEMLPQSGDTVIWGRLPLLAECAIKEDSRGKRYIHYVYSPTMREEFSNPRFFRDFDLNLIKEFSSAYALKIYEYCLSAINPRDNEVTTEWIPESFLKELLGISADSYKSYGDFQKRISIPALKEINGISDLNISLLRKKIAPKNYEFCFQIKRQPRQIFLNLQDSRLDKAYFNFVNASSILKTTFEQEFFLDKPEMKKTYARGERNAAFEEWFANKYENCFRQIEDSSKECLLMTNN